MIKYIRKFEELVNQIDDLKKESATSSKFIRWKKSVDLILRTLFNEHEWKEVQPFYEIDFWGEPTYSPEYDQMIPHPDDPQTCFKYGLEEARNILLPTLEHLKIGIKEPQVDYSKVKFWTYVVCKLNFIKKFAFWKKDFWKSPKKIIIWTLGIITSTVIAFYVNNYLEKRNNTNTDYNEIKTNNSS